jgi:hypothetical protein
MHSTPTRPRSLRRLFPFALSIALAVVAGCTDRASPTGPAAVMSRPSLAAASLPGWNWTGPGTADVTSPSSGALQFDYGYDTGCCESGTWNFDAPAAATGTYSFDWSYSGFHGWFYDAAQVVVWADGPGGITSTTLVSTTPNGNCEFYGTDCGNDIDGPFAFSGSASIQRNAGYAWGVTVSGSNGDCCGALVGTLTLSVQPFTFTGFFAPIDNLPAMNVVKAGSAIPVKFSLDGDQGLEIMAAGSPSSALITCDALAPQAPVEETTTAGNSALSYDAVADQYVYTWKTDKAWAGTCRQLTVTLTDGSQHTANFRFAR